MKGRVTETEVETERKISYPLFSLSRCLQQLDLGWAGASISILISQMGGQGQVPGPFCTAFSGAFTGGWIRSRAANTPVWDAVTACGALTCCATMRPLNSCVTEAEQTPVGRAASCYLLWFSLLIGGMASSSEVDSKLRPTPKGPG